MLYLFETHASLFKSWQVVRYEQEGDAYMLQLSAILQDGSRLEVRDYLFADGNRTYAYQWMKPDNTLRQRWDNAPHWPSVSTTPHHTHLPDQEVPDPSHITNLEDLISFLQKWLAE